MCERSQAPEKRNGILSWKFNARKWVTESVFGVRAAKDRDQDEVHKPKIIIKYKLQSQVTTWQYVFCFHLYAGNVWSGNFKSGLHFIKISQHLFLTICFRFSIFSPLDWNRYIRQVYFWMISSWVVEWKNKIIHWFYRYGTR